MKTDDVKTGEVCAFYFNNKLLLRRVIAREGDKVEIDEKGYVITDENMATKAKGIYAAGDCIVKNLRQVVTACNDGAIAADSIAYDQDDDSKKSVGIELHSGRNRIVRRIFEHLGYEVTKLDRVMFAGLDKYRLPRGEWRFLTDLEVVNLKKI